MRERVTLRGAAIIGDGFVASGEGNRLKTEKTDLLGIVERELNDASDLLVVNAVDNGHHRDNLAAGFVQVVDRFQLYVKQIADSAMIIGCVSDAIELQIGVSHSGF